MVVSCKDCKFVKRRTNFMCCAKRMGARVNPEDSCQDGERRNRGVLIRVTKEPGDVFPEYCPRTGQTYEAEFVPERGRNSIGKNHASPEFCIVDILDKRIVLRKDEYELIGGLSQ